MTRIGEPEIKMPEEDLELFLIKERRLGTFSISGTIIKEWPSQVRLVLSDTIIVRAEQMWHLEVIEYIAYCKHFEPVEEGLIAPRYMPVFTQHDDGSVTWEWKKA